MLPFTWGSLVSVLGFVLSLFFIDKNLRRLIVIGHCPPGVSMSRRAVVLINNQFSMNKLGKLWPKISKSFWFKIFQVPSKYVILF